MKLRSDTFKKEATPPRPIPQTHPVTEKITASNLSSRLLQLPQELKNQIYTYLLGGNCIHVEQTQYKSTKRPYLLCSCRVKTDDKTNDNTNKEINDDTDDELAAHKRLNLNAPLHCMQTERGHSSPVRDRSNAHRPLRQSSMHLPVNLFRTCRQIYHDANHLLYSANTFCFQDPTLFIQFTSRLHFLPSGQKTVAMRRLHLHLTIFSKTQEKAWNRALRATARRFTNLCSLDIDIDQAIWNNTHSGSRNGRKKPSMSKKNNFLTGVSELKKLNRLRELTFEVSNVYKWAAVSLYTERMFLWWKKDMQKWAQDRRAEILGGKKELERV